jgi:hypothetical protein
MFLPHQGLLVPQLHCAKLAISAITASHLTTDPVNAEAYADFNTDGSIDVKNGGSETADFRDASDPREWIGSNHGQQVRDVHMKFDYVSGDTFTTITAAFDGVWGKIMGSGASSLGRLGLLRTTIGSLSGVYSVSFSLDGGTTTHATANVTLTVTVDSGS